MDGYTLTETIRAEEADGARMPVVALTADASHGEAARCTQVGMDDYMTKPLQLRQLSDQLHRWRGAEGAPADTDTGAEPAAAQAQTPMEPHDDLPVLDVQVLPRLIGHDVASKADIWNRYLASTQHDLDSMRKACDDGRIAELGALAHRLSSSSRMVGASRTAEACRRLEQTALQDDAAASEQALEALDGAFWAASAAITATMPAVVPAVERGVLLVDDVALELEVVEQLLGLLGVKPVVTCESGEAALQWLLGRDSSGMLVMLDLNMPGMDGVEFLRQLARAGYRGAVGLISGADHRVIVTAHRMATALGLRVVGQHQKPLTLESLRSMVDAWRAVMPAPHGGEARVFAPQEFQRAIERQEFSLHFEPMVRLSDGACTEMAARVRWCHPHDGDISLEQLLPQMQAAGILPALGRAVLRQALGALRSWRLASWPMRLSLDLLPGQLERPGFPGELAALAAEYGVSPDRLVLDIAREGCAVPLPALAPVLARLRLSGFGLTIDDVGAGERPLAQLRDLPFDALKLAPTFVHGCASDPAQRALFRATLGVARGLGLSVIASGVKNQADWHFVRDSDCDLAQGPLLARPLASEAVAEWLQRWPRRWQTLSTATVH